MRKFVSSIPATAITDGITLAINSVLTPVFTPFEINLTDEEKLGLRTFAEGREGYVKNVSRVATQFPDALSRADTPTDLSRLLEYYDSLEEVRVALVQALETIKETSLGVAADSMALSDRYVQNLQVSRKHDSSLDDAMTEIDDYNSRFGRHSQPPTP